jgi:hypothetical protein
MTNVQRLENMIGHCDNVISIVATSDITADVTMVGVGKLAQDDVTYIDFWGLNAQGQWPCDFRIVESYTENGRHQYFLVLEGVAISE